MNCFQKAISSSFTPELRLRMRFLIRMISSNPDFESSVRTMRGIASTMGAKAVNPKRTSYGALEMDIFVESRTDFDVFKAAIEPLGELEFYRDLQEVPRFLPKADAMSEAIALFNAERFWEAHEVLESLWRVAEGEEKRVLQGLILTCAAFVHEQKGEREVALGVAKRALSLLSWPEPEYHGVGIASLHEKLTAMLEARGLSLTTL
jgi:uncharacterized protein